MIWRAVLVSAFWAAAIMAVFGLFVLMVAMFPLVIIPLLAFVLMTAVIYSERCKP